MDFLKSLQNYNYYISFSQIHGDCVEGRILYGNSPCELIEQFTESIGRPPPLPDWIISGAIVGMQGGTNKVRHVWEQLVAHDVPISAFWLQVIFTFPKTIKVPFFSVW